MIDISLKRYGDRFKSSVGMFGKSRDPLAVIHPKSVFDDEVIAKISAGQ